MEGGCTCRQIRYRLIGTSLIVHAVTSLLHLSAVCPWAIEQIILQEFWPD